MSRKKWEIAHFDKDTVVRIADDYDIDIFTSLLLSARGIDNDDAILDFLQSNDDYCDPFDLIDMDLAVQRIEYAIDNFQKIAIYGDYDADGVTSTAILYDYLDHRGADVFFYIPERDVDGYGLNNNAIDKINEYGAKLIITVDNGISAFNEVEYGNSLGIDFVITDHHQPPKVLPNAKAVVNPHREDCMIDFKDWSGVGVAFKLIVALEGTVDEEMIPCYSAFTALGTVADVVPLKGENRLIVKSGLNEINYDNNVGLKCLRDIAALSNKEITSTKLAFSIAPRINAAGRMGSANKAVNLLLAETEGEARQIAFELESLNKSRQITEAEILQQAILEIEKHKSWKYDNIIIVSGDGWHEGVIGIVAARLTEKYARPCFVLSTYEGFAKGSARSLEGFSLYDALDNVSDCLIGFGGHKLAAGLKMAEDKIDEFRTKINKYADENFYNMPFPKIKIDCKVNPANLSLAMLESVSELEPFGAGNPQPIFGLFKMKIEAINPVGNNKHLRLSLSKAQTTITAMMFSQTKETFDYIVGDVVDLAVMIGKNEYNGNTSLTIQIKDIRPSDLNEDELFKQIRLFEKFILDKKITAEQKALICPNRDDFAKVYRFVKLNNGWKFSLDMLAYRLGNFNYAKVCIIIEAMLELGLIYMDSQGIRLCEDVKKVDLDNSSILNRAKN